MSSPIPIQNIYFLLVYSWNSLTESEVADVSKLDSTELVDLFASVLHAGVNQLVRRGLDQNYQAFEAEIAGVRGRINIGITARRMLASHGRAYCEFDELSVDTLPNQILLATVQRLLHSPKLDRDLRQKLRATRGILSGISSIPLCRQVFRKVQLHGNNRAYRFLLRVCELVLDMSLVDEQSGTYQFRDFIRDERKMARLFENFVHNFFKLSRPDLSIRRERIYWEAASSSDPELRFLPTMLTDISIRNHQTGDVLILDAKFYKETFQTYFDRQTIHSANLYQLYAYLKNLEAKGGMDQRARGMLLYPVVEQSVRLSYELPGHSVQICTVNLAAPWKEIHRELLSLLPR